MNAAARVPHPRNGATKPDQSNSSPAISPLKATRIIRLAGKKLGMPGASYARIVCRIRELQAVQSMRQTGAVPASGVLLTPGLLAALGVATEAEAGGARKPACPAVDVALLAADISAWHEADPVGLSEELLALRDSPAPSLRPNRI